MAAREPDLFAPPARSTNVPGASTLHLQITYGASAPASAWGCGFVGIADTATGKVTITFPRTYRKMTGFRAHWLKCQAGAVLFPVCLDGTAIATDAGSGQSAVVVETRTEAGTATDPASGDILSLEFDVSNDYLCDGYSVTVS